MVLYTGRRGRYVDGIDGEVDSQRVSSHNKGALELESWSRARVMGASCTTPHGLPTSASATFASFRPGLPAQAGESAWQ